MIVFLITNFAVAAANRPAAVVYANDRQEAVRMLERDIKDVTFAKRPSNDWIVVPLTPLPLHPRVVVITDTYEPPRSAVELRGKNRRSTN